VSAEDEDVLARVRRYREAARLTVRADASVKDRCLALLEIGDMAREEPDPTIRTWGEHAIWEEAKGFLGMDDEAPSLPPESYEHRQRRLRLDGYETCPQCFARVATEQDLRRWSELRRAEAERLERRERAVEA
jgi:hypothetical protein